jgi:hypothetical protein
LAFTGKTTYESNYLDIPDGCGDGFCSLRWSELRKENECGFDLADRTGAGQQCRNESFACGYGL